MDSFIKYFVFTGPESTGKSTLAKWLSQKYDLPLVQEYARNFLENLGRTYTKNDLELIAKGQLGNEIENMGSTYVCDTDLLNIIIWYEVKYKVVPGWLLDWFRNSDNRVYFLCHPDIPWEYDPLRENPENRDFLLEKHEFYLTQFNKRFYNITGDLPSRKEKLELIFNEIG